MTINPLIPVIDYTSRDYKALRADMIRVIRSRIPQWTADNPSDFGVALVEAFAYSRDILHYYLDRVANEAYLDTAVQRESLFSIAKMFNYTPRNAVPAAVELRFSNSTSSEIPLPKGTRCQASIQSDSGVIVKNFETTSAVIIPASSGPVPTETFVPATEGRTYTDETIGSSTGFVRQRFQMPMNSVIDGTVSVTTTLGVALSWQAEPRLREAGWLLQAAGLATLAVAWLASMA